MTEASAQSVDHVISARWVLPIAPSNEVLDDHAVVLAGSRIEAICPRAEALRRWPDVTHTALGQQALLPGLVNAHGHAAMTLLRGFADDLPLQTWLQTRIWPLEARWVDADFVSDGTQLAIAEMLQGGTTTYSDMYFFPEHAAAVAERSGLRCQVCIPMVMFSNAWASGAEEALSRGLALFDEYRNHQRINIALGPHSTYAMEDPMLMRIATLSEEVQIGVQIHLHENLKEIRDAMAARGERPLETVERTGLLGPLLQAVHMTQLEPADYELLATHGVSVIHCPQSNLKLASGFCPVADLLDAGVRVALGTDGAASNNGLSMLRELHVAALLAKAVAGDAAALPALQALHMATLAGAETLGFGARIGSLEPGKQADMISVDFSATATHPVFHPESHLVYAGMDNAVRHAWVDGQQLLEDGRPTRMDLDAVHRMAERWQLRIAEGSPR